MFNLIGLGLVNISCLVGREKFKLQETLKYQASSEPNNQTKCVGIVNHFTHGVDQFIFNHGSNIQNASPNHRMFFVCYQSVGLRHNSSHSQT